MRPNYGISRIEQPHKGNLGFLVRITHKAKRFVRYFPDGACGGKEQALARAKDYRAEILAQTGHQVASRREVIPQSVVPGVTHVSSVIKGRTYVYWQARYRLSNGKFRTAKFSILQHGSEWARTMAEAVISKRQSIHIRD